MPYRRLGGLPVNELNIPPDAIRDSQAMELLRAWVINEAVHCTIRPGAFSDPGTWGVFLADVVRHVAEAVHEIDGKNPEETIALIRAEFNADLDTPPESAQD